MKTILSRRHDPYEIAVPVHGNYRVTFAAGRATVPDEVADVLVALGGGFYTVVGPRVAFPTPGSRALVVRDMGLGDLLLITPLLRRLAALGVTVDVQTLARYACLFDGNPSVRSTLTLDAGEKATADYDVVLDLRQFVENEEAAGLHRHRIDGFAAACDVSLGPDPAERRLDYFVTPPEREEAQARLRPLRRDAPRGVVGYVWRASTPQRSWSDETHTRMLAALVLGGWGVVLLDQEPQAQGLIGSSLLNLTGALSIRETAAVMACCDVILTPDTGLFHLAGALGLPTVAYFGPFPAGERQAHRSLTVLNTPENCGLLPCRSYLCLNRDGDGQPRCLALTPGRVLAALQAEVLASRPPGPPLGRDGLEEATCAD